MLKIGTPAHEKIAILDAGAQYSKVCPINTLCFRYLFQNEFHVLWVLTFRLSTGGYVS